MNANTCPAKDSEGLQRGWSWVSRESHMRQFADEMTRQNALFLIPT